MLIGSIHRQHTTAAGVPSHKCPAAAHLFCRLPPTRPRFSSSRISASSSPLDINQIYTSSADAAVQPYVGPVKAVRLKVGVGLEASKTLPPGETLLISGPLALLSHTVDELAAAAAQDGTEGDEVQAYEPTDADIDGLSEQLANSTDSRTKAWLQYLDDGSLDASRTSQLPDLQALAQLASSSSSAAAAASSDTPQPIDEDTLLDITDVNVRVMVEDDALLGLSSGFSEEDYPEPKTLVGIWPELTLIPHSCSPNASVVAYKGSAVVTAVRSTPKLGAIQQNLLGPLLLAPLAERRAALAAATGTKCMCLRCKDEEKQDKNLLQLVADIYEACTQQIAPELEAAVEADDESALEGLRDQLAAYCEVIDAGFSKLGVKQQSQIWLQASLFKLYEYTAITVAACGSVEPRLLELLAALAGEVSPGSSEHLFWARQYRNEIAADEEAYFDGALRQAETLCYSAYQARYGKGLSRALYQRLQQGEQEAEGEGDEE